MKGTPRSFCANPLAPAALSFCERRNELGRNVHEQVSMLAFAVSCLPHPDVGEDCASRREPVPSELCISTERGRRIGNPALVEMDGGVSIERPVFFRCKNRGCEDVLNV